MARVSKIPSSALPPEAASIYERFASTYGPFRNQVSVFAHVPSAVSHIMGLLLELKAQQNIPRRYVELAIVVTSKLNACEYCVAHHTHPLEVEGLSRATIEKLPTVEGSPELTEVDKLVVEYAVAVTTRPGRIRDHIFEQLRAHFSERQIVELTLRIALCGFFNRFNDALMIDNELQEDAPAAAE
jgi:uncharacterized peroxidase-related enzyme